MSLVNRPHLSLLSWECHRDTLSYMETIAHRELRNNSAAVLRRVEAGESLEITNRGRAVAAWCP